MPIFWLEVERKGEDRRGGGVEDSTGTQKVVMSLEAGVDAPRRSPGVLATSLSTPNLTVAVSTCSISSIS